MISHVKSLRFFHADLRVENTVSGRVVGFEGSAGRRLWMPHLFKGGNHGNSLLGVEEDATRFSFRGGGGNGTNGFAKDMNSAVGLGVRGRAGGTGKVGKEKMAGSTAASIGKNKVGGVGADGENHVAGMIADGSIGMSGKIVEKHVAGLFSVFCWRGLVIRNFVQSDNDGGVAAAGVVEKKSGNLLDTFDAEFVE